MPKKIVESPRTKVPETVTIRRTHLAMPFIVGVLATLSLVLSLIRAFLGYCWHGNTDFCATTTPPLSDGILATLCTLSAVNMLTFCSRWRWLKRRKSEGFKLVNRPSAFAPERIFYLGLSIFILVTLLTLLFHHIGVTDQAIINDSAPRAWMVGLITTVPLYEAFVPNYGKMEAEKPTNKLTVISTNEFSELPRIETTFWHLNWPRSIHRLADSLKHLFVQRKS